VEWDEYTPNDAGVQPPLRDPAPRDEARVAYERLMATKRNRLEALRRLLAANGIDLETSDDGIQRLNDWFREYVEADPADSRRVSGLWRSVIADVALFLGEVIIERTPGVEWRFFDRPPKEHLGYRRPVLTGFDVPNPSYYTYPEWLVSSYAHGLLGTLRTRDPDRFVRIVAIEVARGGSAHKHHPARPLA
jgi:hypothetical protein